MIYPWSSNIFAACCEIFFRSFLTENLQLVFFYFLYISVMLNNSIVFSLHQQLAHSICNRRFLYLFFMYRSPVCSLNNLFMHNFNHLLRTHQSTRVFMKPSTQALCHSRVSHILYRSPSLTNYGKLMKIYIN